ncbi:MAG TPA: hypothetical protein VKT49_12990 [Bryobacteraceae bacterium]|nr:hypothetical protein [Bryobacteraceae bacterium]
MLIDQSLSEAVIALQRQDLAPETRDVVDEAARLLADGRDGEARALVEKAEALIAVRTSAREGKVNGVSTADGSSPVALRELMAPLAARLAAGLTEVLTGVLEDLHRVAGDQIQSVATSLQQHMGDIETVLRGVAAAGERLEESSARQQQAQGELSGAVQALQQSDREQNDSIARVAAAAEGLSNHVADRVDAVESRLGLVEDRVSLLDRFCQEVPPQLEAIVARLDGHTDSLRHLEHRHAQRVSTLNQVLDSLARLKEPEASEIAAVA